MPKCEVIFARAQDEMPKCEVIFARALRYLWTFQKRLPRFDNPGMFVINLNCYKNSNKPHRPFHGFHFFFFEEAVFTNF